MTPQAYSPASVTCFFQPCPGPTPEATVSRGCAICLDRGVAAAVAPTTARTHSVRLNGRPIGIAAVHDVLSHLALSPTLVELESPLPIGCGFGVSAAAALATAFALERRFESGRTREDLARIAHTADVVNRTGIGDVGAQLAGGVVHRRGRTGPFDCERLDVLDRSLFVRVFGPLATADVLASPAILEAIRREGAAALEWLEARTGPIAMETLLDRSLTFDERSGLLTLGGREVGAAIAAARSVGGSASMILLGKSVLATRPPADDWTEYAIDAQGARLL